MSVDDDTTIDVGVAVDGASLVEIYADLSRTLSARSDETHVAVPKLMIGMHPDDWRDILAKSDPDGRHAERARRDRTRFGFPELKGEHGENVGMIHGCYVYLLTDVPRGTMRVRTRTAGVPAAWTA